jgi:hypothetical protein
MRGMLMHADCGAEVVSVDGQLCERLMRQSAPGAGALGMSVVRHVCRDYVAWHQPADQRDHSLVDVADGWVPRSQLAQRYAPAA